MSGYRVAFGGMLVAFVLAGAVQRSATGSTDLQAAPLARLGSASACAAYSGLPPRWRQDSHAGMVHLQAGQFHFGTNLGYPDERNDDAAPVAVDAFWIDRTEVTNNQFAAFVAATAYVSQAERDGGALVFQHVTEADVQARPNAWWHWVDGADWKHPTGPASTLDGIGNHPVTLVSQIDALAYARWLGRDLPTEAEWEYAAKAGEDGRHLDEAPRDARGKPTANYWQGPFPLLDLADDGYAGIAPVGCFQANAWNLHDMIGNAWEWTQDAYGGEHQAHQNGVTEAIEGRGPGGTVRVIKGGSFLCSPSYCVRYRAAAREGQEENVPASHIGFRTVKRD